MAAYFVFNYRINDQEAYKPYLAEVPGTLEAHDAEILVADFNSEGVEGAPGEVTVVLKFASKEAAMNWYRSPEYQKVIGLRTNNSNGIGTLADAAPA
jgi:uncharacterized protein (DUF1330 family)